MAIELEEAMARLEVAVEPLGGAEPLPPQASAGRVLAAPVVAERDAPAFSRTAIDGYALWPEDTRPGGATLRLAGEVFAGSVPAPLPKGHCYRVTTGAMVLDGMAVAWQEEAKVEGGEVTVERALESGENVRIRGEEFREGDVLLPAGQRIGPAEIALGVSLFLPSWSVRPRPRVVVMTTGDELIAHGGKPGEGKIANSNGPYLAAYFEALGAEVFSHHIVVDDLATIVGAIGDLPPFDLLLTTGGVSVGPKDFIPEAARRLGARQLFHGLSLRPGGPGAAYMLRGRPWLAMPGNPMAVAFSADTFGRAVAARLAGQVPADFSRQARLAGGTFQGEEVKTRFLAAHVSQDGSGLYSVTPRAYQSSSSIFSLVASEAWMILGPGAALSPGDEVRIILRGPW